jgi:hypothetical protein
MPFGIKGEEMKSITNEEILRIVRKASLKEIDAYRKERRERSGKEVYDEAFDIVRMEAIFYCLSEYASEYDIGDLMEPEKAKILKLAEEGKLKAALYEPSLDDYNTNFFDSEMVWDFISEMLLTLDLEEVLKTEAKDGI